MYSTGTHAGRKTAGKTSKTPSHPTKSSLIYVLSDICPSIFTNVASTRFETIFETILYSSSPIIQNFPLNCKIIPQVRLPSCINTRKATFLHEEPTIFSPFCPDRRRSQGLLLCGGIGRQGESSGIGKKRKGRGQPKMAILLIDPTPSAHSIITQRPLGLIQAPPTYTKAQAPNAVRENQPELKATIHLERSQCLLLLGKPVKE